MPRTVFLTGCSDGGLGAALALAFHAQGYRVLASARNPSKMATLKAEGIETLTLDVLSADSITACVAEVSKLGVPLNILVNNAGGIYGMPITDLDVSKSKELFDLNVWSYIDVTQAFTPLLLKSASEAQPSIIVNQTSVLSVITIPFSGVYNASKAAMAVLSDTMRLELAPLHINVIELKTGAVKSKLFSNAQTRGAPTLPPDSIFQFAKQQVEKNLSGKAVEDSAADADAWAQAVVSDLSARRPWSKIWRGGGASMGYLATFLPTFMMDRFANKAAGMDEIAAQRPR